MFSKSSPLSGFKGHREGQSEGQASQKGSGVNRTGTSWWNSSILLTYDDMIDFPSECSNVGLSSYPHLLLHTRLNLPTHPPSRQLMDKASVCLVAWWKVDEWKNNCNEWRVKSESAIFHLSISLQENKLTTNQRSRFGAAAWWGHFWMTAPCHYINTAMKDIKRNFFERPGQSFNFWMWLGGGGGLGRYFSALTNEQADRLMHITHHSIIHGREFGESPIIH